jgi:hypothetical protein
MNLTLCSKGMELNFQCLLGITAFMRTMACVEMFFNVIEALF